jgi:hypothetical protein
MSDRAAHTHVAEVVRHEVLPEQAGAPAQCVLVLWAPLVQQRFELRLLALPLSGTEGALEEAFPLGSKVLLTETAERVIRVKPLVSSHHADA